MVTTSEPTLKQLVGELNELSSIANKRFSFVNMHMYAEHYLTELSCLGAAAKEVKLIRRKWSFPRKIDLLVSRQFLTKEQAEVLVALNEVRNLVVHNLLGTLDAAAKKIASKNLGFQYTWKLLEPSGRIKAIRLIDLKEAYTQLKIPHLNQLTVSSVVLIGILHYTLMSEKKVRVDEYLDVQFQKIPAGTWAVHLNVKRA